MDTDQEGGAHRETEGGDEAQLLPRGATHAQRLPRQQVGIGQASRIRNRPEGTRRIEQRQRQGQELQRTKQEGRQGASESVQVSVHRQLRREVKGKESILLLKN